MRTFTDDELKNACHIYAQLYEESLPNPSIYYEPPSTDSLQRIYALLNGNKRIRKMTVLRKLATIAAALVLFFSSWFAVDAEAKDKIVSYIREFYENSIIFNFKSEKNIQLNDISIEFDWLPEGYYLSEKYDGNTFYDLVFENDSPDGLIVFSYALGNTNTLLGVIDTDGRKSEAGFYNGMEYELFYPTIDILEFDAVFFDEQNGLSYSISTTLGSETIFEIIKNIRIRGA